MKLTPEQIRLTIAYCKNQMEGDKELRYSINPGSRETAWYRYTRNGGKCRLREAGITAQAVREVAYLLGYADVMPLYPTASWCGSYRRTRQSEMAEREGCNLAQRFVEFIKKQTGDQ